MGLVVTALSRVRFIHNEMDCDIKGHEFVGAPDEAGLYLGGMPEGCYVEEGEKLEFTFSSHTRLHTWKEILCIILFQTELHEMWTNQKQFEEMPFWSFIAMPDLMGAFGTERCRMLFADFLRYSENIETLVPEVLPPLKFARSPWSRQEWLENYRLLQRAYELGSQDGVVIFN